MKRCTTCCMPDTRPDTQFVDGLCSACVAHNSAPQVDYQARQQDLMRIVEAARPNDSGFDCIVPSSGGKDSHWQVAKALELGLRPLVVTAQPCMPTEIGEYNVANLARYATTMRWHPARDVRAKLNRIALETVGDISWPEHALIFNMPFRVACETGIPLILYGENPQRQYGGPIETQEHVEMTRRWVAEFGGFLGLRPADFVGTNGVTAADMRIYSPPSQEDMAKVGVRALFLGQYDEWDSHRNARVAAEMGMKQVRPTSANWWDHENLDNAQTGLHDHLMYRKYGYGRGCAQISVDVRNGAVKRENAMEWLSVYDGAFPFIYAGVRNGIVREALGLGMLELVKIMDSFTDWSLFNGQGTPANGHPVLLEFA